MDKLRYPIKETSDSLFSRKYFSEDCSNMPSLLWSAVKQWESFRIQNALDSWYSFLGKGDDALVLSC